MPLSPALSVCLIYFAKIVFIIDYNNKNLKIVFLVDYLKKVKQSFYLYRAEE